MDVLVSRFGPCVAIAAICWIPYQVANEVLKYSGLGFGAQFVSAALAFLPELLTTACVCSFVGGYLLRTRVTAWDAIKNGVTAVIGVGVIALVQGVSTVLLAVCCVVPAVLGYWLFSVGPTVYVLERKELVARNYRGSSGAIPWMLGIGYSIARGVRLVQSLPSFGRWAGWTIVAGLAILWPLAFIPSALSEPAVRQHLEDLFSVQGRPIELTITTISAVFVGIGTAYFAILKTVYYLDERVRKEAVDLEMRLTQLGERSGVVPSSAGRAGHG